MGVKGLLSWIKKKYPRVIRETAPTFENYDMLFVDIPQYVSIIFDLTAKPYSNSSILMCNILSDIDRLVQFSQPNKVIFFSFESINGLLPYAKAILKRFRTISLSKKEAQRLAKQLNESEGYVSSEKEEENNELLDMDELAPGNDDELEEAFKEFSKLGEENNNQVDNSTVIQKVKEMVDKINQNRVKKAKKAKKDKISQENKEEEEEVELDEEEMPQLMSVDEFLNTVKRADYDKENVPDINDFLIEFQKEFANFVQIKMKTDPLYQNKRVIVSNSFAQGEAEHKIMTFLRNESHQRDWDPNTRVCICSMDNDLINLSLQTYIRNITLVNFVNNDLSALLIDMKVLRDSIGMELKATEQELASRIDDLVMITILISNDFTPAFPDLPGCSMENLFQLYKSVIEENPSFVLFKDGHFELDSVKYFLNKLIKKYIAPNENTAKAYLMNFEKMFPNSPIEEMSRSYFETIAWTMYLYKYGSPSYSYYYKYEYAPPLSTAIQYVDAIQIPIKKFKNNFQYLSRNVQFVLSGGVKKGGINPKLIEKLKSPESPVAYMLEESSGNNKKKNKKKKKGKKEKDQNEDEPEKEKEENKNKIIDIELAIETVEKYEKELNIKPQSAKIGPSICYIQSNNKTKKDLLYLNEKERKYPFKYSDESINDSVFEPEFWPIMEDLTLEQANSMIGKMIFYTRPYKIPAIVKEVLKYDDVSENDRKNAFNQVSIVDPLHKNKKESKKNRKKKDKKNCKKRDKKQTEETEPTKEETAKEDQIEKTQEETESTENNQDEPTKDLQSDDDDNDGTENSSNDEKLSQMKEKLIFFKVTPLSHYKYKENDIKDVIVYAPYVLLVANPNEVESYMKIPCESDFVITNNGYLGQIRSIDYNSKTATIDCTLPSQIIDNQIREIVSHDSENYLTEEEFANQVGITPESVPLIASRLILMPDDSNIAIKFYSTRYNKLMCGFCIQNEDKQFLFAKGAVPIAKKYLNQPKIFKQLIEQSAAQLDKRLEKELEKELEKAKENKKNKKKNKKNKNKNKNKEPKVKLEKVVGNEELADDSSTTTNENENENPQAKDNNNNNNDDDSSDSSNDEHGKTDTSNDEHETVAVEIDNDDDDNSDNNDNDNNAIDEDEDDNNKNNASENDNNVADGNEKPNRKREKHGGQTKPENENESPRKRGGRGGNSNRGGGRGKRGGRGGQSKQERGEDHPDQEKEEQTGNENESPQNRGGRGGNSNRGGGRGKRGGRGGGQPNSENHSENENESPHNRGGRGGNSNRGGGKGKRGGRGGQSKQERDEDHPDQEKEEQTGNENESPQKRGGRGGNSNRGRGRGGRGGSGGGQSKQERDEKASSSNSSETSEKRKLYLNEIDNDDEIAFNDVNEIELPSNEETENNPPFSIELPTAIRGTIITRLDNYFKHHKSVNASIFYPFDSSSLSIESIHKIDQIITQNLGNLTENKELTYQLDQLTSMNEYIETNSATFKAGDRVILQKNRGFGVFGNYGTVICANDRNHKAVICLDRPISPSNAITFTNYRMKNIFSVDCVVEFPYSVLKHVNPI